MKKIIIAFTLILCMVVPLPSFADPAEKMVLARNGTCADAVRILTPLANGGNGAAQIAMGDLHSRRHSVCEEMWRSEKALKWYLRAAEGGNVEAQKRAADTYHDGGPKFLGQAVQWYRKAAVQGDTEAQSQLARMYEKGKGVPVDRVLAHMLKALSNRDRALKGSKESYKANDAEQLSPDQLAESTRLAAQWQPGKALPSASETGGRPPSQWYREHAAGDADAAYRLGMIHKDALEGTKDDAQAVVWLRRAAEQGHADAQYELGEMYGDGRALPEDYVLAYMLSTLAAKSGNVHANNARWRHHWAVTLTPQQQAEGQALAAQWLSGTPLPLNSQHGFARKFNLVKEAKAKQEATADVIALFDAASEGDEQGFMRLIDTVGDINDYVVERHTLVHALLLPAKSLRDPAGKWHEENNLKPPAARAQNVRAHHLALLPAKTRMLGAALQRGAGVHEGTPEYHGAALHWASMFGTPEMVELLLRAGADPRQYGGTHDQSAPLEFSLMLDEHGMNLPPMLTARQRSDIILQLLEAGAERPFKPSDEAAALDPDRKRKRPEADYRLWDKLVMLTSGAKVLSALEATGTTPYFEPEQGSLLTVAAQVGNVEAVKWIKQRAPRRADGAADSWTDAAIWAMYAKPETADAMLAELIVKEMPWMQIGPIDSYHRHLSPMADGSPGPTKSTTLLGHAALTGRTALATQLVKWGAPVNASEQGQTALSLAVQSGDAAMVGLLLSLGADPLEGCDASALLAAVRSELNITPVLRLLLDDVVQKKRVALADIAPSPLLEAFSGNRDKLDGGVIRTLVDAGFSAKTLGYQHAKAVMTSSDPSLFAFLADRGWLQDKPQAKDSVLLASAIQAKRTDLLPRLLQLGLDPNAALEEDESTPLAQAIAYGDTAAFDLFMRNGGRIDMAASNRWGTALELAVMSKNPDMLKAVSGDRAQSLADICLPDEISLDRIVLDATDAYWATLRQYGFGTEPGRCAPMVDRLINSMANPRGTWQVGWMGQRLAERLKDLGGPGAAVSGATAAKLHESGRDDLLQALRAGGWQVAAAIPPVVEPAAAQKSRKADLALQENLAGMYYVEKTHEVGSKILLARNGQFEYVLMFGATDQYSAGTWKVLNQQVVFRSRANVPTVPYRLRAHAAADAPSDADVTVQVIPNRARMGVVSVLLVGEKPVRADGYTQGLPWSAPLAGPLKHIVLFHPDINNGRAFVYDVADGRRSFTFDAAVPVPRIEEFNVTMAVRGDKLVWSGEDNEVVYKKANAKKGPFRQ